MEWMFMPLKRYADFSGRSRRMEFWMWQLFQIIVYVVFIILMMALGGGAMMMMRRRRSELAMAAGGVDADPRHALRALLPGRVHP